MKKKSILFTIPAFLIYTVLMIVPIIGAFLLSFTDWNGISASYNITGAKNYLDMLSDERLRNAIFVTLKITVVVAVTVNIGPSDCDDAEPGEANDQRISQYFLFALCA
jgi:ABC-type sugar transport system permease subunit